MSGLSLPGVVDVSESATLGTPILSVFAARAALGTILAEEYPRIEVRETQPGKWTATATVTVVRNRAALEAFIADAQRAAEEEDDISITEILSDYKTNGGR